MLYVAQALGPSAQLGALSARFFDPERETLVFHKLDRLEFAVPDAGNIEVNVYSGIAAIQSVHLAGRATASIIVLTTCQRLFLLDSDPSAPASEPSVVTSASISIHEPFGRLAEYQDIVVDQHGRCVLVHAYSGLVRVVPLPGAAAAAAAASSSSRRASHGAADESNELDLDASYNVRLSTLNVSSLAFVPTSTAFSSAPVLAAVYASHTGHKVLATFTVDLVDKELGEGPLREQVLVDPGSELVIPLGNGVAVVGEESMTWYAVPVTDGGDEGKGDKGKGKAAAAVEESGAGARCRLPVSRVTAWTALSDDRLLLGDLYGKLLLVTATLSDAGRVTSVSVEDLGDATSATSIVPMSATEVYLSSRFGDSQIIRLPSTDADAMHDDATPAPATELALVQSFSSLAPVLDFVVVGESSTSSSGYLVTCSGAYKTGSLRVVRSGVGVQELASLEIDGVQRLWSFTTSADDRLLVLGFFDETRVFKLVSAGGDDGGDGAELDLDEVDLPFFDSASATLFAGALAAGLVVQVTAQGVACDGQTWRPEGGKKKITAAAAREGGAYLAVAVEGGELVVLRAENGQLVNVSSTTFQHDIAALALSPSGQHVVVALWTSQEVHLVDLASSPLAPCATHRIDSTFLIRSLALTDFSSASSPTTNGGDTTLLAGLGDGTLVSLAVDLASGSFVASSSKAVALGKRPLQVTEIVHGDACDVFVASDRPTIVSRSKDRLVYSSVNVGDTHAVCALPNGALALASSSSLTLAQVGAIQQVDVRTVPLDEDEPRRIAHDAEAKCFVVTCARRDVDRETGETSVSGVVRLLGEDFATRATLALEPGEEAQSLTLAHAAESGEALFLVGTTRAPPSPDSEPTEGRLLVLRTTVDGDGAALEQVSETAIGGCPYAVVPLAGTGAGSAQGYVATAVNSQVGVWALGADGSLSLSATWGGAFVAYTLAAGDEPGTLVVGDALRSVTLLRYTAPTGAPMQGRLDEVARDYRSRYMLGVAPLGAGSGEVLGAETDLNLFTLGRDEGAERQGRVGDAGVLEARGQWHLGEMVSRFRPGSLGQLIGDSSGAATAQLLFATSAGSIGVIASLSPEAGQILSGVERNLRAVIGYHGHVGQEEFRSYKVDKTVYPSAGFIDGAFVEQFLDLSVERQEAVVAGQSEPERLSVTRDEVASLIEEVARVH
ncbi:uncharacterized protein RHOBADRAFT_55089 [Rhodotorula graminis WP1]|uniref:DNA damage-binding protein 1 n=1 Tax=Rhodotorula graminis (strain WP1) TaxID=578459 RepID=A0A0P9FCB6_RHOGW|nr:uncharacterized protein RHOBADRAFT_55089 [Rhodotorula graminis WP1]KPV73328.1 hypothetical protein RHOBADRAFT_55089 [Rhodotorula graminis WP1]